MYTFLLLATEEQSTAQRGLLSRTEAKLTNVHYTTECKAEGVQPQI